MKFTRQQYLDLMTFQRGERQMFVELFGLLVGVDEEWKAQGATEDEIALSAFDWDFVPVVDCGGVTGIFGGFDRKIISENDEYRIEIDEFGRHVRLPKRYATLPLPLDFPVRDWNSWKNMKPLFTYNPERINWDKVAHAKQRQVIGDLVVAHIPGAFDYPRELMGDELALVSYYEAPDLMQDMISTFCETAYCVLDEISRTLVIDQLSVHEDMAGKAGPLVGPRQVNKFFKPYFKVIWDLLSSRGTKIFDMDSDGNMMPVLDAILDCGLNSMHPMEPAAGMDIVAIRKKYGSRLAMRGGLDKHVLRKNFAAIEEELQYKMQPLMQRGGMAFGLDHRITNGTPLQNYRFYVDTGRKKLGLPKRSCSEKGWARMAF